MAEAKMTPKRRNQLIFYICLLAIPLAQFLVFYVYVNINSVLLAFQEYDVLKGFQIAGFNNFKAVFDEIATNSIMQDAIKNTALVFVLGLAIGTTLPLLVSFYIYKGKPFADGFRVILFMPSIISSLALVLAYKYFVELGIPAIWSNLFGKEIHGLLSDRDTKYFVAVLFFTYWFGMGSSFLLYVSAMCSISDSVVEAAQIDGVTPWQEFLHITLPLIYPTYVTFVVVNISTLFANQVNLFSIDGIRAPEKFYTIGYYIYMKTTIAGFESYPYLSALGLLCTLIALPLCLGVRYLLNKIGPSVE